MANSVTGSAVMSEFGWAATATEVVFGEEILLWLANLVGANVAFTKFLWCIYLQSPFPLLSAAARQKEQEQPVRSSSLFSSWNSYEFNFLFKH